MSTEKAEKVRFKPSSNIENCTRSIIMAIGEDIQRPGLIETPNRVARAYAELTAGYKIDPTALINNAIYDVDSKDMVVISGIKYFSLCEHHLLPFYGYAHIAYMPKGKIIGLSKIPRIVDMFARRLQIQERLTSEIANFIVQAIGAAGVSIIIQGTHTCVMIRGVKQENITMTTSAMRGVFESDIDLQSHFMRLININHTL